MKVSKAFTARHKGSCGVCTEEAQGSHVVYLNDTITHLACLPGNITPNTRKETPPAAPRPNLAITDFVAFDTETTGLGKHDRIVTAALVHFTNGQPATATETLINPGIAIPAAASNIHGITTQHAREHGHDEYETLLDLVTALDGKTVIAYNIKFDIRMLEQRLNAHGIPHPRITGHDPFTWFKQDQPQGPHRLQHACQYYGIELENWHNATADATAAGLIAIKQTSWVPVG
jgi:DNA polymerase III epsilon subunit-like protein